MPTTAWKLPSCNCRTWGLLSPFARDMLLRDLMEWAGLLHQVQLRLRLRDEHVVLSGLLPLRPGNGRSRVLSELLSWADCAVVVLGLTPSKHFGSDIERLTKYFAALGFTPSREPQSHYLTSEAMIRYPIPRQCQLRF